MSVNDISFQIESTIEELIEQAENLKENADVTIGYAQYINNEVVNRHDYYVPLDDQPYGEELVRTNDIVEEIELIIADLEQAREEDPSKAIIIVKNAEDDLNEYKATFEDCFTDTFIQEAKKEASDNWDD